MNSKQKGARGERELAKVLRKYGFNTRRGQQYCGANGDADVVGLPNIHIECKRVERLNLYDAMAQAKSDAKQDEIPVVMHRKDKCDWLVTLSLEGLNNLEIHNKSYDEFEISDGIIYCDIPYKDTVCGSYSGFDHNSFYDWAENQKVPVYISEYTMPSDRFTEIATFSKRQQYNSIGSGAEVQEKIFIPKHQQKITQQLSLF